MIGLIDCGSGNVPSVAAALKKVNTRFKFIKKKNDFDNINKIILPGIGSFKKFIDNLKKEDLFSEIQKLCKDNEIAIFGICVGYQALFEHSDEFGETTGLGLLKGEVKNLKHFKKNIKIPHVGWNNCSIIKKKSIFKDVDEENDFYFTHSYAPFNVSEQVISSITEYQGEKIISSIEINNIFGVQFHPEKSQSAGLKILKNFCEI
ncbi:MAG: imidazole glycerol phosphate synthase subunit HisH [Flavobacteriaceae bacterium]|nr:imidazole glycerol phosphate synthase subunit HisH [Flavobacteriaceae bacterium]|tara:strand:+ start:1007 stop:1621 length:615 start_codon:yes stop_codon:yes gene_type:complete